MVLRDFKWLNWKGDINVCSFQSIGTRPTTDSPFPKTYSPGDHSCVTDPVGFSFLTLEISADVLHLQCWYHVPGADGTQSIIMQCTNDTSCQDFEVRDIQIVPQSLTPPTVLCGNLQNTSSLGFLCVNGTFIGTN